MKKNSNAFFEVVNKHDHPVASLDQTYLQVYYKHYSVVSENTQSQAV